MELSSMRIISLTVPSCPDEKTREGDGRQMAYHEVPHAQDREVSYRHGEPPPYQSNSFGFQEPQPMTYDSSGVMLNKNSPQQYGGRK